MQNLIYGYSYFTVQHPVQVNAGPEHPDDVPGPSQDLREGEGNTGQLRGRRLPCVYLRGGYCKVHKAKGIKKTSQSRNTVRGEDGKLVTKYTKKTHYVCDLNLTGGGG